MIDLEEHRHALFGIAYRMLGDRAAAEDVVQETFFKARDADAEIVASPRAWLSTVVTRLCLDHLKSARVRREQYVGPWLPEPLPTEAAVERETISMAFMVLLETLSPIERAVFLLHDVFDYTHAEVAAIVQEQEATVRQILHRAKAHVVARRPRFSGTREQHALLMDGFIQACIAGDVEGLGRLLAADVVCYTDGGGKAVAATKPVRGAADTARFLAGLARKGAGVGTFDRIVLNGEMTLVARVGGRIDTIVSIATDGERITEIDILRNPDKLARLAPS
jgi:RNA polymerase sigma-70 factor (ECF subfamily)